MYLNYIDTQVNKHEHSDNYVKAYRCLVVLPTPFIPDDNDNSKPGAQEPIERTDVTNILHALSLQYFWTLLQTARDVSPYSSISSSLCLDTVVSATVVFDIPMMAEETWWCYLQTGTLSIEETYEREQRVMKNAFLHEDATVLRTIGLTKTFGTLVAVNDLELEVQRGDVFGFLGPNGSGKTTTIRMVLGLLRPTSGHIHLFGVDNSLSTNLFRLGALIEMPVFYPYLSGLDNIRVLAARSGMVVGRVNNSRLDAVLDLIDLRDRANDLYHTYSLGMKQRLGIGAALLTDPELILLDEPTNGLDPAGVHDIRQLIQRLATQGKTIFLSSHLLYEVQQVCNRVAILHKGHLLKQGNVQELLYNERIVIRMNTMQETEKVFALLQRVHEYSLQWLKDVRKGVDTQRNEVIFVHAPTIHSTEIAALLAQQNLFPLELYHYQATLEEFFLDVTTLARGRVVVPNK